MYITTNHQVWFSCQASFSINKPQTFIVNEAISTSFSLIIYSTYCMTKQFILAVIETIKQNSILNVNFQCTECQTYFFSYQWLLLSHVYMKSSCLPALLSISSHVNTVREYTEYD